MWVLLMFHPTSTLNKKDCMLYFVLRVLDIGFRHWEIRRYFTHVSFIVVQSEMTLATKRLRKIGPVKRDAIFCSFFLRLLHWERPISTSRLIIRSWLIGVERRLLIVGLRTVCASSIFSSIIDPKRDDIIQDFVSYFVECWFSYERNMVFFSIKSSSIVCSNNDIISLKI